MLVKVITLSFDSVLGGFNDSTLRDFLKDCELVSIRDHFFIRNEMPYLTLVIQYFPIRQELNPKMAPQGSRDEAWRETLTESDLGLFNLLREWRSKSSRKEGVPPYVIFTNRQLAQVVKLRPQSLSELLKVDGFGKAKADKYGSEVLEITRIHLGVQPSGIGAGNVHPRETPN